mgnify:CR=1 FL=1
MQIKLLGQNTSHRGPGKVYQNLSKGLSLCGHEVNKPIIGDPELTVCLQFVSDITYLDSSKTLFGPNIVTLPSDYKELYSDPKKHFLVPSQWAKDLYCQFDFVTPDSIHVWSVGIDTDLWKPVENKEPTQDCFIYFKNRSDGDLKLIRLFLNKLGLSYSVLEYGKYTEQELRDTCNKSKFAMLLTGTESQGIAYMEILSMGIPCYVFNQPKWKHDSSDITCPATSVPYFSKSCGTFSDNTIYLDHLSHFVASIEQLDPRSYIVENHSLEKSAVKLLAIANEYTNVSIPLI